MQLFLIYIPFLFTQFQVQNSQIYTWQQYGLSLSAPANLTETKDEDTWEIEDENLDFWVDAQKFTFEEEEKEVVNGTAKNGAINAAKLMGYENVTDGGPIPNVPEGHFVITTDDDGQDV